MLLVYTRTSQFLFSGSGGSKRKADYAAPEKNAKRARADSESESSEQSDEDSEFELDDSDEESEQTDTEDETDDDCNSLGGSDTEDSWCRTRKDARANKCKNRPHDKGPLDMATSIKERLLTQIKLIGKAVTIKERLLNQIELLGNQLP